MDEPWKRPRGDLAVIETYEGLCAIAHGRCGCCGWEGVDAFDIGLVELGDCEYEYGEPPSAECPCCEVHEIEFPYGLSPEATLRIHWREAGPEKPAWMDEEE